jgi:hypothetical protein
MTTDSTLASPSLAAQNTAVPRPAGLRALLPAARGALQWRLLLWWAVLLLLPAVAATLPAWQWLATSLDHSPYAATLAERLDMIAFSDLVTTAKDRYAPALDAGGIVALVLTLLLSPLLSGMAVAAARAHQTPGPAGLLAAGAQLYPRLARMLAWSLVPLGVAGALGAGAWRLAGKAAEAALLESDAHRAAQLAMLATVVLLVLAHATVDAGRAVLADDHRRTSAVAAWWRGCGLLLRRPLAVLGTYVIVTAVGLGAAGLLAFARTRVPALGTPGTIGAIVLAQLVVLVLGWMRAARLFALAMLVRRTGCGGKAGTDRLP